jgi:2-polyprenyl-3-methyl-5-hydroxy-6-metoxy-1,4-benzoquinol methylase
MSAADTPAEHSLSFWENAAEEWDTSIALTGNDYWTYLQEPTLSRLCKVFSEDRALDLATGNGLVARWLIREGAESVLATDGSTKMLELAEERKRQSKPSGAGILRFEQLDLVDEAAMSAFAQKQALFDVITINMALMDISTLRPLARLTARLLTPKSGR